MAKILVVDDSKIMVHNIQAMLTQAGYIVVATADNGLQAFREYEKHRPDLVTMDLAMPGMDGIEAMKKIISAYPQARIVVVSAIGMKEKVLEAIENGASHFLVKPITFDKLTTVVKTVLRVPLDKQRRVQMLERLRTMSQQRQRMMITAYSIENVNDKYYHVALKSGFDGDAAQSLLEDIEELLFGPPLKILINFGDLETVDEDAFAKLNIMLREVTTEEGTFRALSHNKLLTDKIKQDKQAVQSGLSAAIKYRPAP